MNSVTMVLDKYLYQMKINFVLQETCHYLVSMIHIQPLLSSALVSVSPVSLYPKKKRERNGEEIRNNWIITRTKLQDENERNNYASNIIPFLQHGEEMLVSYFFSFGCWKNHNGISSDFSVFSFILLLPVIFNIIIF